MAFLVSEHVKGFAREAFSRHKLTSRGDRHFVCKRPGSSAYWFEVLIGVRHTVVGGDIGTVTYAWGAPDIFDVGRQIGKLAEFDCDEQLLRLVEDEAKWSLDYDALSTELARVGIEHDLGAELCRCGGVVEYQRLVLAMERAGEIDRACVGRIFNLGREAAAPVIYTHGALQRLAVLLENA